MRVLLILVVKLLFKLCDDILEFQRRNRFFSIEPQLFHQFSEANRELTLGAKRIRIIDFLLEVSFKEILGESDSVTETLHRTAQVARIIKVPYSSKS